MRVGVICSAGGSACFSALNVLFKHKFLNITDILLITDRDCGSEKKAKNLGVKHLRIDVDDADKFSKEAYKNFKADACEIVFLFFNRLASHDLYSNITTINIHPSLLPAFSGLGALPQAQKAGVKFIGATLHNTNSNVDDGEIIGQVSTPIQMHWSESDFNRVSYLQKTYLMLCMIDLLENNYVKINAVTQQCTWLKQAPFSPSANPCLITKSLIKSFSNLQADMSLTVINE